MEKAIATISKIQFIRNAKVPVCLECIYFVQGAHKIGRCTKFGEKDVVSGKITYESAEVSRITENMCSRKGAYFEKKNYM